MLTTDASADQVVKYLENERKQRGLVFKAWIRCKPSSQTQTTEFAFTHDPRWLPSYVPGAYQFHLSRSRYKFVPQAHRNIIPSATATCKYLQPSRLTKTEVLESGLQWTMASNDIV
jgi:hypothetical protein